MEVWQNDVYGGELQYIRLPWSLTGRFDSKSFQYEHIPRSLSQVRETNYTSTDSACIETTSKPL